MKLNIRKVLLMTLMGIGIGLGSFASALSLLTQNKLLSYVLLTVTYLTGIYFVKVRNKYNLIEKVR